ncbi:MAG TPA: hypothetical protein VFT37_07000 [Telluria sp.]|nr:hypothetical protein [Telluria sp.]
MNARKTSKGANNTPRTSKEKANVVAEGSLQTRAPGAGPGNSMQHARPALAGFGGSVQGERGGPGSQQSSWSARQQAQRLRARAEEGGLGQSRQSGYGGNEQDQRAGSEESAQGGRGGKK